MSSDKNTNDDQIPDDDAEEDEEYDEGNEDEDEDAEDDDDYYDEDNFEDNSLLDDDEEGWEASPKPVKSSTESQSLQKETQAESIKVEDSLRFELGVMLKEQVLSNNYKGSRSINKQIQIFSRFLRAIRF